MEDVEGLTKLLNRAFYDQNYREFFLPSMTAATRLIKKLDKVLANYDSFGDNPGAHVEEVLGKIEKSLDNLRFKSNPDHMARIYVERDRAMIKQVILNRVMAGDLSELA
ncbi:hypothetical protein [Synechococcus sp. MU1625]|uniref:hypothetical protein n=1 Tax=Synechococcus sp. MU1625 TaxID=2508347 RepID=UPI001CF8E819|nr:hypothetical protein [Synechococcus sp. MU1625]